MTGYLENLLGAFGLAVTDAVEAAALETVGLGGQTAGALVLLALRPRMSVKRLSERLRLSHPGAVRLVDRLVAAGWALRGPGQDRRSVQVALTAAGLKEVERLRRARGDRLGELAATLSPAERAALEPVLEKLLRRLTTDLVSAYANCRLCDTPVCEARGCPVEAEARGRFVADGMGDR